MAAALGWITELVLQLKGLIRLPKLDDLLGAISGASEVSLVTILLCTAVVPSPAGTIEKAPRMVQMGTPTCGTQLQVPLLPMLHVRLNVALANIRLNRLHVESVFSEAKLV